MACDTDGTDSGSRPERKTPDRLATPDRHTRPGFWRYLLGHHPGVAAALGSLSLVGVLFNLVLSAFAEFLVGGDCLDPGCPPVPAYYPYLPWIGWAIAIAASLAVVLAKRAEAIREEIVGLRSDAAWWAVLVGAVVYFFSAVIYVGSG